MRDPEGDAAGRPGGLGPGRPERLGRNLTGFRPRRLSRKDRLIYIYDDDRIDIFAVGGHYDDK